MYHTQLVNMSCEKKNRSHSQAVLLMFEILGAQASAIRYWDGPGWISFSWERACPMQLVVARGHPGYIPGFPMRIWITTCCCREGNEPLCRCCAVDSLPVLRCCAVDSFPVLFFSIVFPPSLLGPVSSEAVVLIFRGHPGVHTAVYVTAPDYLVKLSLASLLEFIFIQCNRILLCAVSCISAFAQTASATIPGICQDSLVTSIV